MITVSISRSELVRAGACPEGLALFDGIKSLYDDQRAKEGKTVRRGVTFRLTRLHTVWAAVAYPGFFGWLVAHDLIARANLDGANLTWANLTWANLTRANLTRANLDGANLDGANLDGANLTRANLDGANLTWANLDGANLTRANLTRANLDGANLTRANLDGANLDGANLDGAIVAKDQSPPEGWESVAPGCTCCSPTLRRKAV